MNAVNYLRALPIRRKLTILLLVPCLVVLLLAGGALVWFQLATFRASFERDLSSTAEIVANNATGAVAFKDEEAAVQILTSLRAKSHVVAALLVRPDNTVFARYGQQQLPADLAGTVSRAVTVSSGNNLLASRPVMLDGKQIATLHVTSDYRSVYSTAFKLVVVILVLVVLVAAAVAMMLGSRLQRFVSEPVLRLTETAHVIADKADYSVRAREEQGNEFGVLTRAFNQMLARIEAQEWELRHAHQQTEALIHSIDGIVWECTPDTFHFTFVSRQAERILGYPPDAWTANPSFWHEHLHPEDAAKAIETCAAAVRARKPYSYEYRMLAADGRVVWIRERGVILVDDDQPVGIRGILLDITEEKKAAEQLEKLNRQLMSASRQAGMAEVAAGVLHNVGNVLNSVNVSANLVNDRLNGLRAEQMAKLSAMLNERRSDLAGFLTNDPRGKLIPDFITSYGAHLQDLKTNLRTEMQLLIKHLEHIKEIVAMQQNYAKVAGVLEDLPPAGLVEDALLMHAGAFARHGVAVQREFTPVPPVRVDKHKVLQILVNLFRNAKYAMDAARDSDKVLKVGIRANGGGRVKIVVEDNGIGIPRENLTRIFQHGFTTKSEGHGFGLHSGACAAKELGGSLVAESEGPGRGATFTLELPVAEKKENLPGLEESSPRDLPRGASVFVP
jgi:PAS domain S-box-containing protein